MKRVRGRRKRGKRGGGESSYWSRLNNSFWGSEKVRQTDFLDVSTEGGVGELTRGRERREKRKGRK